MTLRTAFLCLVHLALSVGLCVHCWGVYGCRTPLLCEHGCRALWFPTRPTFNLILHVCPFRLKTVDQAPKGPHGWLPGCQTPFAHRHKTFPTTSTRHGPMVGLPCPLQEQH